MVLQWRFWIPPVWCALTLAVAACSGPGRVKDEAIAAGVTAVLEAQQNAWNRGDIDGFMEGYDRADSTTFVSSDELTRGWQTVLERYKQHYSSREAMGTLSFSDLSINAIGSDFAVADGRWRLMRANDAPHGRFTLLFQRVRGNWRIIHDTTTSATP